MQSAFSTQKFLPAPFSSLNSSISCATYVRAEPQPSVMSRRLTRGNRRGCVPALKFTKFSSSTSFQVPGKLSRDKTSAFFVGTWLFIVLLAGIMGIWATEVERAVLGCASGLDFVTGEACRGGLRGRWLVRRVSDCGSLSKSDIGAGGGMAVGIGSGGEEEIMIDSLKDAPVRPL
jgi:hypothetical protein